ncbi:Cache 3/Cache 2 fusion domain-containing protein [Bacillus shivajii]|uniref:PAS domain-containing sensor histidine kinase n=1 Tax=Bacillus shivajii TaxID=1983719 RepID=UPI001CF98AE2|nr:PAS domain-containing sensor histidine kinase [Bacillus shivajii]UCZ53092.1 Cache 3/Cache 2 fusion domain-containing protein [Bacillus shivajii]
MFQTLRSKLLVFFLIITFIPMTVVGMMSYHTQKNDLTENVELSLSLHSTSLSAGIKSFIQERLNDVRYKARNPVLRDEERSNLEIREQFHQFLDIHQIYSGGIFVDPDGLIVADSDLDLLGIDVTKRPWFSKVLEGQVYMSDIYHSEYLFQELFVVAAPVYNYEEEIIGIIAPTFDIDALYKTIREYNEQQRVVDSEGYAFLVNAKGEILSHPDQERVFNINYFDEYGLQKQTINEVATNQDILTVEADNEVHAFSKIERVPGFQQEWYIGVAVNKDELYEPLSRLLMQYLLVFGLALVITTIAVIRLSNYLVRPIQQLVESTNNFALGKQLPKNEVHSYEEVNQLNRTFHHMVQKLSEREKSHKKSTLIIETTDNGVFAIDRKTKKVTMFNRTCEEIFSLCRGNVIENPLQVATEQSDQFKQFMKQLNLIDELDGDKFKKAFEIEFTSEDERRSFFVSVTTLPNLENPMIHDEMLVVFSDLTEKRIMERELLRSEKLKVAGEMSAGLAHEIKNPLTTIRGMVQLMDKQAEDKDNKYNQIIITEIDRVNSIINDLLNIANPSPSVERKETNIETLLDDLLTLYVTQLKHRRIDVEKVFSGKVPIGLYDENKLKQVFINLIQNAIDAMDDDGKLTIKTNYVRQSQQVVISIQDTGAGMDEKTLDKLGTPFYTTKESGTGLGLTVSYRIINEMNGSISVSSQQGQGTTFTVRLPLLRK